MAKSYPNTRKRIIKGNTYWIAKLVFPADPLTGQARPPWETSAKTAAEADAKRTAYLEKWKQNPKADVSSTFGAYLTGEFIQHELDRTKLPDTSKRKLSWAKFLERKSRMERLAERAQATVLCQTLIGDLEPKQFKTYLESEESKLTASQFNKLRRDLKIALRELLGRTRLPVSEFYLYFPAPADETPQEKTLVDVPAVLKKLGDSQYPIEYRALVGFQLITRCRPQEISALEWTDVDWESGKVSINKRLAQVEGTDSKKVVYEVREGTKTGKKGDRLRLPLGEMLPLLEQLRKERMANGPGSKLVFCHSDGTYLDKSRRRRLWVKIQKAMGLPEGQFYWLKTAGNSWADENDVDDEARAATMGHTSTKMATGTYLQVSEAALEKSVGVFKIG